MRRHADLLAVAVLSALLALWSNRWSDGDLITAAWFFDAAAGAFPLRRQWLLSAVLHDGLKWLAVLVWLGLLAGWSVLRLRGAAAELRGRLAFALVASLPSSNVATLRTPHQVYFSKGFFF